ncbi:MULTISPECIES: hypothetical protein [Yersinia pseudotuberculosis complex]|nr:MULTISPECIES: hypothetical protein [Yersinia pseudotuberculosis complex]
MQKNEPYDLAIAFILENERTCNLSDSDPEKTDKNECFLFVAGYIKALSDFKLINKEQSIDLRNKMGYFGSIPSVFLVAKPTDLEGRYGDIFRQNPIID